MLAMVTYGDSTTPFLLRLRRAIALPIYAVALVFSYLSDALTKLAASIANDP
jgi:hypothetical protein